MSLTPLHAGDIEALNSFTRVWKRPHVHGTSSSTLVPEVYLRQRYRSAATCAGIVVALLLTGPLLVLVMTFLTSDVTGFANMLNIFAYFVLGAIVAGAGGAGLGWYWTGGRHRTQAGAEPRTQLTFTATSDQLVASNKAGWRVQAPWAQWRIANVRSEEVPLRYGRTYLFEALTLVTLREDASEGGRVWFDPQTLSDGSNFGATVLGMIASRGLPVAAK